MSKDIVKVELPTGSLLGLEFAGSPPVLKSIQDTSPIAVPLNWYAQTVSVRNVEYSYIADTAFLNKVLDELRDEYRTLTLYKTPMVGPPQVTLTLPPSKDIGIDLEGFPPVVINVNESSEFYSRVPEGFVVDRLIFPKDEKELSLASGGFTATNVNRAIVESSNQQGRLLVLKKVVPKGDTVSSSRPFDLGAFTNQSKWTIKRLFGKEDKASAVKKGQAQNLA